jgi:DNA-directed RNA polymerase specialized sigma24 family protein
MLRNRADSEDVVQEATLRAFRFFGRFHGADARAWLLQIVRNTCCTLLGKNRPVSNRCYRKGLEHTEAVRRLLESAGTQFDLDVVQAFIPIAEQEAADVFAATGTSTAAVL